MSRVRAAALLAVAAVALSACGSAAEPTPTPTAAFASEEEAFAAAEETYRAYIAAYNEVDYRDPNTFTALDEFTDGEYAANDREGLSQMHAEGNVRDGETEVVWFEGLRTEQDIIEARACNDVSQVIIVDSSGASIVSPERPPRSAVNLVFSISPSSEVFLIESQGVEDAECS